MARECGFGESAPSFQCDHSVISPVQVKRPQLFLITSFLAGLGGALGSMVGNAFGRTGLWVGGVLGGLLGAHAAVAVAKGRGWIAPQQFHFTVAGAALGFLIAAG